MAIEGICRQHFATPLRYLSTVLYILGGGKQVPQFRKELQSFQLVVLMVQGYHSPEPGSNTVFSPNHLA